MLEDKTQKKDVLSIVGVRMMGDPQRVMACRGLVVVVSALHLVSFGQHH